MTSHVEIAFFDRFLPALQELPSGVQRKTNAFIKKFRTDPKSSGINFERINNAANPQYRSVRIDKAYRAILLMPDSGNQYVLLWVDHHDDAYAWAVRTQVRINPRTSVLQVYPILRSEDVEVDGSGDAVYRSPERKNLEPSSQPEPDAEASPSGPLFSLDGAQLTGVGVPETHVGLVERLASRAALDGVKTLLPVEAYEALALFADGMDWDEVWEVYGPSAEPVDPDNLAASLSRPGSQRQFRVVESEQELARMLEEPLAKWRVFLHPSQRRLVDGDRNGPVRVTGGAGTGKTVVAMHRAVRLARLAGPTDRPSVMFLTYNTNLAKDIASHMAELAEPDVVSRIEVVNIDAWIWRVLTSTGSRAKLCTDRALDDMLDAALTGTGVQHSVRVDDSGDLPRSFFTEEWARVILPQGIHDRDRYLEADRIGRGVALSRRQRAGLWPVFDALRKALADGGWIVRHDAMLDMRDRLAAGKLDAGCRHVVVDETQDMGAEVLQLVRAMVPEGKNDLFFVGDGRQRIFGRAAVMKHCGIHIVGRSHKLRINYRTTEEIRRFAIALMDGVAVDDLDGGADTGREYLSLTNGPVPILEGADDEAAEIALVANRLDTLSADAIPLESCCVMLRTTRLRDRFAEGLRNQGIRTVVLGREADNPEVPGVRVANMHRVKGLEFQHVFMAAMSDGVIPNTTALRSTADKTERRVIEQGERALAHVCATRAIASLTISWHGKPSEFIEKP